MSRWSTPSKHLLLLLVALQGLGTVVASVFNCVGGSVQILAHPDDDLLFQNPDLRSDFDNNLCITSIYLTSGDSGNGLAYAKSRETGNAAAYAYMAGATNSSWTEFYATFGGQPVLVKTLVSKPQIQKMFFRLPDGQIEGEGVAVTGYQSLRRLYFGTISSISSIDGVSSFTLSNLRTAIAQIITARQPTVVRSLDHLSDYDSGDHSDHYTSGRIAAEAAAAYARSATFSGYMGYPIQNLATTISTSSTDFTEKCNTFFMYTPYDSAECQSFSACTAAGRGEAYWLQRQYIVTSSLATTSPDGDAETPAVLPSGTNVARQASVSASTYAAGQPPSAIIDGDLGGYPGNDTAEWSSDHEGAGAWAKLVWPTPVLVGGIVLYDRPNSNDWITGGTLTFSDGSTLSFDELWNDGSPTVLSLPRNYTTTSLLLTVTSVSSATSNVGLSEIQVYGTVVSNSSSSSASAFPSSTSSTSASTTASSAILTSTTASPTSSSTTSANLARTATATASSWSSSTDQTPTKAIDGLVGGYTTSGGDYTQEWASSGGGAGTTFTLTWAQAVTANRFVLYDRPNLDDQMTGATVSFSDGSSVTIPALNNDGSATTVNFSTRTFTSLVLTVTSVSSTTYNVGLSEFQVYLVSSASSTTASSPVSTGVTSLSSTSSSASLSSPTSLTSPHTTTAVTTSASPSSFGSVSTTSSISNSFSSGTTSRSTITFSTSTLSPTSTTASLTSTATPIPSSSFASSRSTTSSSSSSASPSSTSLVNYARQATATASSWANATDQGPEKAIDGMMGGYTTSGGDYTKEWASDHEGNGATLTLTWSSSILLNTLVLYDRPNLDDQVLNASISFSDGSVVCTGTLENDGSATKLVFKERTVRSLKMTVTKVSGTTSNIGLSELEAYYNPSNCHCSNYFPHCLFFLHRCHEHQSHVLPGDNN
ncbi:hypothetical protein JCM8547_005186 [Rhodosporidiobolus lusitaniae]